MNESTRGTLRLLLGVWYGAGAVLLIELLAKGDVQSLAARIGGSTLAMIAFLYAVTAGARLAERESWSGLFGAATVLVSTASFLLLAVEIWSKHPLHAPTRTFVMVAVSLFLGTISLLLDGERDEDEGLVRLARGVASLALFVLGILIVISACGVDMSPRIPGLAAALFVFPALSLPVLRLIGD
jgi:hypothetical protein